MSLTAKAIAFITSRSARRFEAASLDPVGAQRAKLLSIVRSNADTEYGRRYGFSEIRSIADYQRRVPVVDYEDIRPEIDRLTNGASRVLTREDPIMFARTSGTTGDAKYIPLTPTCQGREHRDVMRAWLAHAQGDHKDIFDAKVVSLVSPAIEGYTPSGLPFGSTSGHIYKNMPAIIRRAYSIPYEVFEIEDYEAKYYAIMRIALAHDVRFLSTANPSSILKLCEKASQYGEAIIRDVRDGTVGPDQNLESAVRASLERRLKPDPSRAQLLAAVRRRRDGLLLPADYWPRLSLIGCWKGGTVGHYLERFPGWFDPDDRREVPIRDWGYLSSEARGSVPLSDIGSSGALTIASNFFEFVEAAELEMSPDSPEDWTFRTVADVAMGAEYYVFLTTTGGLYRYDINDVVQMVGFYNRTPEIVFLRKGRGMTNITGEKVSVNQIIDAFTRTSKRLGLAADHYRAEADYERSRYVFMAEFDRPLSAESFVAYLRGLDDALKEINLEYKAKRDSQRLAAPALHVMKEGWYERRRKSLVSSGKRMFQAKTVLLAAADPTTTRSTADVDEVVELTE